MLSRKLKFKALCNVFILNLNHEKCVQFKTLNGKLHIEDGHSKLENLPDVIDTRQAIRTKARIAFFILILFNSETQCKVLYLFLYYIYSPLKLPLPISIDKLLCVSKI